MDRREEQESEIEALESIYPTEFSLLESDPYIFRIFVKSEGYEDGDRGLCVLLKFKIPPSYPDEVPEFEVLTNIYDNEDEEIDEVYETNLELNHITDLKDFLTTRSQENLGMAMVFTMVSETQEWLNSRYEKELREREEEERRRIQEAEEAEMNQFEGTKVNVQNFMEWKLKFDAEMAIKRRSILEKEKELIGNKLTGRELFTRDTTLNESDLKFLEEEEVTIDESLFADVDELDLNDDEEEDDDE